MSISGLSGAIAGAGSRRAFQPPSFESLDTNNDNSITLDELKAGAPGGATAASDKRVEALFKKMDADGNGSISASEKSAFDDKLQAKRTDHHAGLAFLAQQLSGPSNDDVFAATDSNGDGSVSLDELSNDDAAKGVSSDSLLKLFSLIDSNGDGAISKTESSDFPRRRQDRGRRQPATAPPPPGVVDNRWTAAAAAGQQSADASFRRSAVTGAKRLFVDQQVDGSAQRPAKPAPDGSVARSGVEAAQAASTPPPFARQLRRLEEEVDAEIALTRNSAAGLRRCRLSPRRAGLSGRSFYT